MSTNARITNESHFTLALTKATEIHNEPTFGLSRSWKETIGTKFPLQIRIAAYTSRKIEPNRIYEPHKKSNLGASAQSRGPTSNEATRQAQMHRQIEDLSNSLSKKPAREVERRISSGPAHDMAPIPNPAPQTVTGGGRPQPAAAGIGVAPAPRPPAGTPAGRGEPLLGFAWEWSDLAWRRRKQGKE